nr:hypothetical protein CFP56_28767 [Quercus suber]
MAEDLTSRAFPNSYSPGQICIMCSLYDSNPVRCIKGSVSPARDNGTELGVAPVWRGPSVDKAARVPVRRERNNRAVGFILGGVAVSRHQALGKPEQSSGYVPFMEYLQEIFPAFMMGRRA